MSLWQLAAGSMIGRSHRMIGRNNQDAWHITESHDCVVAVVADGCSSGAHSEFGAMLGVQVLAHDLLAQAVTGQAIDWRRAERAVVSQLDILARNFALDYVRVVEHYCLFTLVGAVLTPQRASFFACGDGYAVIGDEELRLGPFPSNQPPYLAYQLLGDQHRIGDEMKRLTLLWEGSPEAVDHFLIGSDGLEDLVTHEVTLRPGLTAPVGPLSQFWQSDRYFRGNPELVSRELKLIGRDWPHVDPSPGLLSDDTTLVVGRKISSQGG